MTDSNTTGPDTPLPDPHGPWGAAVSTQGRALGFRSTPDLVARTNQLLTGVFGAPDVTPRDDRFDDGRLLAWQYLRHPLGPAHLSVVVDPLGEVLAHCGVIPAEVRNSYGEVFASGHACNVATAPEVRQQGLHRDVMLDSKFACHGRGDALMFGVSNAEAIKTNHAIEPVYQGPLPVTALPAPPTDDARWSHVPLTPTEVAEGSFDHLFAGFDQPSRVGLRRRWDTAALRWRLANPRGGYWWHHCDDLAVVTALDHITLPRVGRRIPAVVALKVLVRDQDGSGHGWRAAATPQRRPLGVRSVGAMCRARNARAWVHAGHNGDVTLPGVAVPMRLRPAPLHFIGTVNPARIATRDFRFDVFEFLDFDAY